MKKFLLAIVHILVVIIVTLLLTLTLKGDKGNPLYYQNELDTKVGSPYEASNTTARYALALAIIRDKTFYLNDSLAKFSAPDVADNKEKFISIFTPGVSFIALPLFLVGDLIGLPQLITFFTIPIFAILNFLLIITLARKLGAGYIPGFLGGFIFLFGTNAFSYAQSLSQHHITVTLLLLSVLIALSKKSFIGNIAFGLLFGIGMLIDIPNILLMTPVAIYHFAKQLEFERVQNKINFSLKLSVIGFLLGIIPMLGVFAFYNYQTTGSYTTLAQSLGRSKLISQNFEAYRNPEGTEAGDTSETKTRKNLPFNSRKQLQGFYTLMISNERAWLFYSPVVFLGICGLVLAYLNKRLKDFGVIALSVLGVNILIYSMFGDPWGGWAFGPRYLIPSAAVASIGLALTLQKFRRNVIFVIIFIIASIYSISINTLGVLTTSMVAPKVEAIHLPEPIPYTYEYNLQRVRANLSSSLLYNYYLQGRGITLQSFVIAYASVISLIFLAVYSVYLLKKQQNHD